jgi:transglutaminase-like putative cysteine protease
MSRLHILHTTEYSYSIPVAFARHRLVVRPREGHDVQVEWQKLSITPENRISWRRDLFGNSIALVDFLESADRLAISNEVVVHRRNDIAEHAFSDFEPVPLPAQYSELEQPVVEGYLKPVYPREAEGIRSWLIERKFPGEATALAGALNGWIYENIEYRRREERGVQSPLETLSLGSGSCRDMATLMLEAARGAGLAARFASGYLESAASAAGRAATHAWVEVYFAGQGWCGCDPTIDEPTSKKHILTGVSSHPRGVMPVSGAYVGGPEVYLGMTVGVKMELIPPEDLPHAASRVQRQEV